MSQNWPYIELNENGHIAHVRINRPDKHNGLNYEMFCSLIRAAKYLKRQKHIRVVILSGNGPSFCAGLDMKSMSKKPANIGKLFLKWPWQRMNAFQRAAQCWRDLPMPVIAAIHGNCFGGGLQIALGADVRISAPDAQLSIREIKWGLVPDMSLMVNISRLMPVDLAQELAMTGRVIDGEQAAQYHLVSHLSDEPIEAAEQLAESIAQQSPSAIRATKKLFKKAWKADSNIALAHERWTQMTLLGRKNQRIALHNGLSPNKPKPFVD